MYLKWLYAYTLRCKLTNLYYCLFSVVVGHAEVLHRFWDQWSDRKRPDREGDDHSALWQNHLPAGMYCMYWRRMFFGSVVVFHCSWFSLLISLDIIVHLWWERATFVRNNSAIYSTKFDFCSYDNGCKDFLFLWCLSIIIFLTCFSWSRQVGICSVFPQRSCVFEHRSKFFCMCFLFCRGQHLLISQSCKTSLCPV